MRVMSERGLIWISWVGVYCTWILILALEFWMHGEIGVPVLLT